MGPCKKHAGKNTFFSSLLPSLSPFSKNHLLLSHISPSYILPLLCSPLSIFPFSLPPFFFNLSPSLFLHLLWQSLPLSTHLLFANLPPSIFHPLLLCQPISFSISSPPPLSDISFSLLPFLLIFPHLLPPPPFVNISPISLPPHSLDFLLLVRAQSTHGRGKFHPSPSHYVELQASAAAYRPSRSTHGA